MRYIQQQYTSFKTSRRQVPALHKILATNNLFKINNLDIGGERFDDASKFLASIGINNFIYDPYNRSKEHNDNIKSIIDIKVIIKNIWDKYIEPEIIKAAENGLINIAINNPLTSSKEVDSILHYGASLGFTIFMQRQIYYIKWSHPL